MAETLGHKKTFTNTVAKRGHEKFKIKIFVFNCSGLIPECNGSISPSNFGGQLSDTVFEYLYFIHPVNGILLVRVS